MSANFTPSLQPYNQSGSFRFWCQKVLPLVYDDSLSYYELLCKVVSYLNNVIQNVDGLHVDVENLLTAYNQLQNYVNTYFDNLDLQTEINNALDRMVSTGELADYINTYFSFRLNIGWAVRGPLTSENFAQALNDTLNKTPYVYIPEGEYNFDTIKCVTLQNKNIDVLCHPNAVFYQENSTDYMFHFINCSVKWEGGKIRSGISASQQTMIWALESAGGHDYYGGAFLFDNCINNEIKKIVSPWNKLPGVLVLLNTTNTIISQCEFNYSMLYSIHILEHCVQTTIENCTFNEIWIPTNGSENTYYCYAVASGLKFLSDLNITPPDILIYRNNTVINSADTGLDTHGATNVIIENNTITNCNTAITCYNDSNRVTRPTGWIMENVTIRNNKCYSNYVYSESNEHPYLLLSPSNPNTRDEYNYTIEGNYFSSKNSGSVYGNQLITINRMSNVKICNNIFDGQSEINVGIFVQYSDNVEITGNTFDNFKNNGVSVAKGSKVIAMNNSSLNLTNPIIQLPNYYSYVMDNDNFNYNENMSNTYDLIKSKGNLYYNTLLGICSNLSENPTTNCTISNGTITTSNAFPFVVGMRLNINGNNAYVRKILSDYSAAFYSSSTIPNGSTTFNVVPSSNVVAGINPQAFTGDFNNMNVGFYFVQQDCENQPVPYSTYSSPYSVYCLPRLNATGPMKVQIANIISHIFVRTQYASSWQTWNELAWKTQ